MKLIPFSISILLAIETSTRDIYIYLSLTYKKASWKSTVQMFKQWKQWLLAVTSIFFSCTLHQFDRCLVLRNCDSWIVIWWNILATTSWLFHEYSIAEAKSDSPVWKLAGWKHFNFDCQLWQKTKKQMKTKKTEAFKLAATYLTELMIK